MELLLILTYAAFCTAVFKIFRIPVNKWSIPTAILGGVVFIAAIIFTMNYNHPYSEISRQYFNTIAIVPEVTGQVIEVPVVANQPLKKGDILFKIDPEPFQAKLDALQAQLKFARSDLEKAKQLATTSAISQRQLEQNQESVDNLIPKVASAKWELDNTIVRAPMDGYVTQVFTRPGVFAASMPLRPVMVFVPQEKTVIVGWFRQNSLLRLKAGYEAEVSLDSIPGQVFSGKVTTVMPALAEGQVQASGNLLGMDAVTNKAGRVAVAIEIDDPDFAQYEGKLPAGLYGQAAVYSEYAHHVALVRKILLRMAAWMNYIFPFH